MTDHVTMFRQIERRRWEVTRGDRVLGEIERLEGGRRYHASQCKTWGNSGTDVATFDAAIAFLVARDDADRAADRGNA